MSASIRPMFLCFIAAMVTGCGGLNSEDQDKVDDRQKQALRETQALVAKQIAELSMRQAESEKASLVLAKLNVVASLAREESPGVKRTGINLAIENGTDHEISKVGFFASLADPNGFNLKPRKRYVSAFSEDETLKPGAKTEVIFDPQGWDNFIAPEDAVLTVEMSQIYDPEGKLLFEDNFTDADAEQLQKLQRNK